MTARSRHRGFTLVELASVLAVICLLAGLLVPVLADVLHKSRICRTAEEMTQVATASLTFRSQVGVFPDPRTAPPPGLVINYGFDPGLVIKAANATSTVPSWGGPYLTNWPETNAWSQPGPPVGVGGVYDYWSEAYSTALAAPYNAIPGGTINYDGVALNSVWVLFDGESPRSPAGTAAEIDREYDDGVATTGNIRLNGATTNIVWWYFGEGPQP